MKFLSVKGNLVNVNINQYKIDWTKAPSKGQKILQDFLYPFWKDKIVLSEMRLPGSLMRADLICLNNKIHIEYSPATHHGAFNKFFHKNKINYMKSIKRDMVKEEWSQKNGFTYIELVEDDLKNLSYDFFIQKFGVYL